VHFLAIRAIEPLDIGVLVRLARLDVVDEYSLRFARADEGLAEELRSVVADRTSLTRFRVLRTRGTWNGTDPFEVAEAGLPDLAAGSSEAS